MPPAPAKERFRKTIDSAKATFSALRDDRAITYAAALAFYTALSLPPLVILLMWTVGTVGAEGDLFLQREARSLIGEEGAEIIASVIASSDTERPGASFAGAIGLVTLIFGATGVFAQLHVALNRVWDVEAKPGKGLWGWVRSRLLSVGVIGMIAFLALVSLAASAAIGAIGLADDARILARIANLVVTLLTMGALFAVVFKVLPDVEIPWRRVLSGSLLTAALFIAGRWIIGLYISEKGLGSSYGAAGSVVVVLVWVYFNAILLLIGAEWTRVSARRAGDDIHPSDHAVRVDCLAARANPGTER